MKKSSLSLVILATALSFTLLTNAEESQTVSSTQDTVTTSSSIENVTESSEIESSESSVIEITKESDSIISQENEDQTSVSPSILRSVEKQPKQGAYIKDGSYVYITKKNYDIWQNFNWKNKSNTSKLKAGIYQVRGRYEHQNGNTYYSLFDGKGTWIGYLNAKATKKTVAQGNYISDDRYVQITGDGYQTWGNFNWKPLSNTFALYNEKFKARGRYEHFNGAIYYSLYDNNGKWAGYINTKATTTIGAQGLPLADGRKVKITKKNYDIWQNFNWKKKSKSNKYYGKELTVKNRYNHFNGQTYYSLFDNKNNWIGYLNSNGSPIVEGEFGSRPTTLDELDFSKEHQRLGKHGLTFPSQENAEKYARKVGYIKNQYIIWEVDMKKGGTIRYTVDGNFPE